MPACIICALTMDRLGRKPLMVLAMAFLGIFCVAAGFIPDGDFRTLFMLFGKFGASAGFSIVYQFTAELYPSEIRGTGMGMCSMFGRFGGIAAPQESSNMAISEEIAVSTWSFLSDHPVSAARHQ